MISDIKKKLGSVSSKALAKDKKAKGKAMKDAIEKKRKEITKEHHTKKMSGAGSLFD